MKSPNFFFRREKKAEREREKEKDFDFFNNDMLPAEVVPDGPIRKDSHTFRIHVLSLNGGS